MTVSHPNPFAIHGGEKMLYDVRQGPVAVMRDDTLYVAYQANPDGSAAHPHVVTRDMASGVWSEPVRIGTVPNYDHHFAPVLWFDGDGRLHALFNCHGKGGTHLVADEPGAIDRWSDGPPIADSISYPHILPMADGKVALYSRELGHMGHWGYTVSDDGGFSWSAPRTLVDMDRDPRTGSDCWAGSYQSVVASRDRRALHIAFAYLDERRGLNPIYNRRFTTCPTLNRYHLHYLRLDIESGALTTIDGEAMAPPVNREQAERCKVWDTGWRLTNMPAVWVDEVDTPSFLMPVSDKSPWECAFHYVRRVDGEWKTTPVAETNSTWCGGLLRGTEDGRLSAIVAAGKEYGELLDYGGGDLEEWTSSDDGETWALAQTLNPEPGHFYNNPRLVECDTGEVVPDTVAFFGWKGPGSLHKSAAGRGSKACRGKAYLWRDGEWL